MPFSSRFALPALLATTKTTAQVTFADVWLYSSKQCAGEAFSVSASLAIWEDSIVTAGENGGFQGSCSNAYTDVNDEWPVNSAGKYNVHVDSSSIPAGCQAIFYRGAPTDDIVSSGPCWVFERLIPSGSSCLRVTLPKHFDYS
jgi:hypothetical protein